MLCTHELSIGYLCHSIRTSFLFFCLTANGRSSRLALWATRTASFFLRSDLIARMQTVHCTHTNIHTLPTATHIQELTRAPSITSLDIHAQRYEHNTSAPAQ